LVVLPPRLVPVVLKQIVRHRTRSLLTIAGVAVAMFLYTAVQAMQAGVRAATTASAADTTLIVYRKDRFCPATSRLPEDYARRIAAIAGVESVMPVKIVVNNCRTSLNVVTYRGVPKESFLAERGGRLRLVDGSIENWLRRSDAALIGEALAARQRLKVGDSFDAAGITVHVAGIIRSDDAQDAHVAYTDVQFIQRAVPGLSQPSGSENRGGLGTVTQFNVKVRDPQLLDEVAAAIDAEFARAQDPTDTYTEKAFAGRIASDVVEIVGFARWLGFGCLIAVLALVANSIVLSVQDRLAEHAVLQTLGYTGNLIGRMIVAEALMLSLAGAVAGVLIAGAAAHYGRFALTTEGVSIPIAAGWAVIATGMGLSILLGTLAGLAPALQASRRSIAECLRA
jgi:putative ABC transport system permease protein